MMARCIWRTIATALSVSGMLVLGVDRGHAQGPGGLPAKGGWTTVTGCLQPGLKKKLVLVRPTTDHIASVTEPACNLSAGDSELMLELHNTKQHPIDASMVGHWVEVSGRLEHVAKSDTAKDPREIHVRSARAVPVIIPPPAEVAQTRELPAPIAPLTAPSFTPPEEQPAATSGTLEQPAETATRKLPKTASPLALMGLTSLLSLAGGLGLRVLRRRAED